MIGLLIGCRTAADPSPTPLPPPPETSTAVAAYPLPTAVSSTLVPSPYPLVTPTPPATTSAAPESEARDEETFLPFMPVPAETAVAQIPPTQLPPTPIPTIDVTAVSAQLATQNQQFAPVKIGFHVGVGGNTQGLDEWMIALDAAGIPFFLKSVDNAQPLLFAQQLREASGVPHVLVYRKVSGGEYDWDVPNYALDPKTAAELHWQLHRDAFPPELDPSVVWIETINEVDKNQAEWLGQFAWHTADMSLRDGFKWAAFGWASGEPEPEQWQTPAMLAFLRRVGENPERLAIALHEYSYLESEIGHQYPYKVGRFQSLLAIADANQIPRPTILITEWGWVYDGVPDVSAAMADIAWAAEMYGAYPEVKGAAIWYLGSGFRGVEDEAQRLIRPLTEFALQTYYAAPLPPEKTAVQPDRYLPNGE